MNTKKILAIALLLGTFQCNIIHSSIVTDPPETPEQKEVTEKTLPLDAEPIVTRSINIEKTGAGFAKSAFHSAHYFFLGTTSADKETYSLARPYIQYNIDTTSTPLTQQNQTTKIS